MQTRLVVGREDALTLVVTGQHAAKPRTKRGMNHQLRMRLFQSVIFVQAAETLLMSSHSRMRYFCQDRGRAFSTIWHIPKIPL